MTVIEFIQQVQVQGNVYAATHAVAFGDDDQAADLINQGVAQASTSTVFSEHIDRSIQE